MEKNSQVAIFVKQRIQSLGKKQTLIAQEAGFEKPNVITMIKQGKTKLPLAKVGVMAKALETDPIHLLKLCLSEYQPETWEAISPLFDELLTKDEMVLINSFRSFIGGPYVSALTEVQFSSLNAFLKAMRKDSKCLH